MLDIKVSCTNNSQKRADNPLMKNPTNLRDGDTEPIKKKSKELKSVICKIKTVRL